MSPSPTWRVYSRRDRLARHQGQAGNGSAAEDRLGCYKRQSGSHRTLEREAWPDIVFAFHERDEIGPRMLSRIAKRTGLEPEDL